MSLPRSPLPNPNRDSGNLAEEGLKCPYCHDGINSQLQDCCIIDTCQHIFHRSCIEQAITDSAQCPLCKEPFELSNLKKYPILCVDSNEISTQTGTIKKSRPAYRGKGRGSMANRPITRNLSRTLHSETLNVSQDFEFPTNAIDELPGDSSAHMSNHNLMNFTNTVQNPSNQNGRIQDAIPSTSNEIDYSRINQMIEKNISKIFQNLNLGSQFKAHNTDIPITMSSRNNNPDLNLNQQPNFNSVNGFYSNQRSNVEVDTPIFRPDRVTFIIQNWNLQFDGSRNGLSVDEFLYRIKTLTREHLNDNFTYICKNLPLILTGKAKEWYWRYHKSVDSIQWNEFCGALRCQFKDLRSNFDLMEAIRGRKMRPGESFDSFYDDICSIADRLQHSIPEEQLVEILVRNLRPDIRHELLYVPILTIPHLRKLVQMRENLLNEEPYRKYSNQKSHFANNNISNVRKNIAELNSNEFESEDLSNDACVDALNKDPSTVKCWNCDETGHFWDDCLKDRKVFCYGCGTKNMYKPQCVKCATRKISVQPKNSNRLNPNRPLS